MELVILGFLMIRSLSQYDLKKALSKELSPYYSPSLGTIQATLKKLILGGLCTVEKTVINGRKKNTYTITKLGRERFNQLMTMELTDSKFEAESGSRLFFLGLLEDSKKEVVLSLLIRFVEDKLKQFTMEASNVDLENLPEGFEPIARYQFKCLEYGKAQYELALSFFERLSDELKERKKVN